MLRNLFKGGDKKGVEPEVEAEKENWFDRLKFSLTKTRNRFISQLSGLLRVGRKIDEELMEEIEEILIQADVGVETTLTLMDNVRETVKERGLGDSSELETVIKEEILNLLGEDVPLKFEGEPPYAILVLGVNGAGKTTTIGKLASRFNTDGNRVLVAAGDTFRAAAEDQLAIWCERAGAELIRGGEKAEPASVVFDAVHAAKNREVDVLIVDTAGRLHTKKPLMDELSKIRRVMGQAHTGAPHEVLLVIDGTVGQNALMQAKIFNEAVPITGVAITKLDGTAKGGIVLAVQAELGAPVKLIGIGEKLDDLRDFAGADFVEALFAAEDTTET
ncbi:signal recognition particle-docking protein FtsY [Candidatus Poribacteria bacterium]|nr:MAG: signal recognition particle-docking protein FtsY [Candidatus Poribacteria bacterium]